MPKKLEPSVRFNLKNRKEDETLIVAVYRYAGKRLVYSTQQTVPPKFWNDKTRRPKETTQFPRGREIDTKLDAIKKAFKVVSSKLFVNGGMEAVPVDTFKDELDYYLLRKERPAPVNDTPTLLQFIDQYVEARKNQTGGKRGTWKIIQTVANHINEFAREKQPNLDYADIDYNFKKRFEDWLFSEPRRHSINYASKVFEILRQFMRAAKKDGYHENLKYMEDFSIQKVKTPKTVLSFDELRTLFDLDLSANLRLERVRDLFIIGAFSGLRFSDFIRIQPEHIIEIEGEKIIEIVTLKTDTLVSIPLLEELEAMLKKHSYRSPKTISNQKFNDYIKEVCKMAGINDRVVIQRTNGNVRKDVTIEKWEVVSSHTCRRSFATNFYELGIPAGDLMLITGHATERQFFDYINRNPRKNALQVAKMARMLREGRALRVVKTAGA